MQNKKNGTGEKARLIDLLIHDLTGPLSVVSTSASSLLLKAERYGPLTENQKRVLERVLRNARKAQTLLHEMIEIYRSQEGLFQSDFFSVKHSLEESLLEVLDSSAPEAAERLAGAKDPEDYRRVLANHGIFLEMSGRYSQALFCHDQRKICQILRNLMSNALKYRRTQMKVCITGDVDLCVSVEDDGRGIPEKDHGIVFERFVRLTDRNETPVQGFGLGLTGVKTLVEAMGGEILLESEEGTGTRFKLKIPPLEPPGFHARGRNASERVDPEGKKNSGR